jgi:TolA-binding protein
MNDDLTFDRSVVDAVRRLTADGVCPPDALLVTFYEGSLPDEHTEAMREHLASCARCVASAREARRFLGEMGAGAPARSRVPRIATVAAAAVAASLLLIVGMRWLGRDASAPPLWVAAPAPYAASDELVWRSGPAATDPSLDAAATRYRAGDFAGAVADFSAYTSAHPDDPRGRFYLGVSRLLSHDAAQAVSDLAAASALPGAPPDTAWYLALARLEAGDRAAARSELARIVESGGPHRDDAREILRRLREREGR